MHKAPLLCIFGTSSDVGKSWISAGFCRLFHQSGISVTPYKAQNMSNNAGVTPEGLEMGRAQIVQAHAAGLVPHVDMNPLLLKPNTEVGAQVIALGKIMGTMSARAYFRGDMDRRQTLVIDALERLRAKHDLVIAEGAGSCAEVNLRKRDLVNMPIAHHGDGKVVLVADIHRGGVFAQIVGTMECMPPKDRERIAGFIINRFRGDPTLFEDGMTWLEKRTGVPGLGVVPWSFDIEIEDEDSMAPALQVDEKTPIDKTRFNAAILRLPHLSNFTDFDALRRHGVELHYLTKPRDLSSFDVLIIPGTKNTRGDLDWLKAQGWPAYIHAYQGSIIGLCGGYQILGESIRDPYGIEGEPGTTKGLGLLPVQTVMAKEKVTKWTKGYLGELPVEGYEIHVGHTQVNGDPLLHILDGHIKRPEGCRTERVLGTYLHGVFDSVGVVSELLGPIRPDIEWPELDSHIAWREQQFDSLADHLRTCIDLNALSSIVGLPLL